jgi:hypothetical protein
MSANAGIFNFYPLPSLRAASTTVSAPAATSRVSAGALSVLLLAALVATLVLLADRFISTWADEHLFLGWVLLWAVIFGGLALFAGTARTLAARAIRALDGWSQAHAQSRAEARLWDIARSDPRVMADLVAIRAHAQTDSDFSLAPVPAGIEPQTPAPQARGWAAYIERVGQSRVRNMHSHYI